MRHTTINVADKFASFSLQKVKVLSEGWILNHRVFIVQSVVQHTYVSIHEHLSKSQFLLKVNLRGLRGHRGQDEYQSNRVSDLVYKRQIFPLENRNLSLKNPLVWHQILLLKSLKKMWFAKISDAI